MLLALCLAASWAQEPAAPEPPPAGELVAPVLVEQPALPWPEGAAYTPATVELLLLIDERGAVEQAALVSGEDPFAALVLAQVWSLRFTPAVEVGQPVAVELPFVWVVQPPPEQLRGQVLDPQGAPLAGLSLTLSPPGRTLSTDAEGRFAARELPEGPAVLTLADPRFAPVPVTVTPGELLELTLRAPPEPEPEGGVVGSYTRLRPQVETRTLTAEQIRTTPGSLGDPVRVVQNLPGVVRTPFDSGWLLIRGGDPEDAGMFIDGVQVPLIYHVGGFTSVLHPGFIEAVDYSPGTWDARYGRSTSGVVDIRTRPVNQPAQVLFGADVIHAGVYARTPLGPKQGLALAVRRSYLDRVLSAVLSEEQAAIAPRFWDGQLRWDSPHAGLFLMGFSDTIEAPTGVGDETASITLRTGRVHGRVSLNPGRTALELTPVLARDQREVVYDTLSDARTSQGGGLRVEWRSDDPGARLGWVLGLDSERYGYTLEVNGLSLDSGWASADPYAQVRLGGEALTLDLGLRADTLRVQGQPLRWGLSPKARLLVPVVEGVALVGDFSQSHRYPALEWVVGLPGGPNLDLERSRGGGAGVRVTERAGGLAWALELDGWARRYDNLTVFEPDGTLGQGQGRAYGVDALARGAWRDWSGWVAYTGSRSLRRHEPGAGFTPYIYDQPHYLVTVLTWTLPKGWSLSGRFRVGSGYAWNQDDTEALDILRLEVVPLVPDLDGRLQTYHALDVKLARQTTWRQVHLELYLDVQNATNRRIAEPMITGIEDRDTVYGFGLPILPVVGVQGGWARPGEGAGGAD